jgi:hypothetical protein
MPTAVLKALANGAVNGAAILGVLVLWVGGGSAHLVATLWIAGIAFSAAPGWIARFTSRARGAAQ